MECLKANRGYVGWLSTHDRDLYRGNGKPGITTRIQSLEDAVDGVDLSRLEARVMQTEQYIKDFQGRPELDYPTSGWWNRSGRPRSYPRIIISQ